MAASRTLLAYFLPLLAIVALSEGVFFAEDCKNCKRTCRDEAKKACFIQCPAGELKAGGACKVFTDCTWAAKMKRDCFTKARTAL